MISIAIIVPYFGRLPHYFDLWLKSAGKNPTVQFFLFTDDHSAHDFPANVCVCYESFNEMRDRIQKAFDFEITLDRPYKLCDFRAAYGEIFAKEISGYGFWGHCDLDIIFGNIREFIRDSHLAINDKIFTNGHLTLYRNEPQVNSKYRTKLPGYISYKEVMSHWENFCFDESSLLQKIWATGRVLSEPKWIADIQKEYRNFSLSRNESPIPQIFVWENGDLIRYTIGPNGEPLRRNFLYIHLQARKMPFLNGEKVTNNSFIISPNGFMPYRQMDSKWISDWGARKVVIDRNWHYYKKFLLRIIDKGMYEFFNYRRGVYLVPERSFLTKANK